MGSMLRKLKPIFYALSTAVAILLAVGCVHRHSPAWKQLETAAKVMDDIPDSALLLLQSIAPDSLVGEEERARYSLLITYALYKNDVLLKSDSTLRAAKEYYAKHKKSREYMMTLFCVAEIAFNNGDYRKAMQANMESYELAAEQNDPFFQAKNAEAMSDIFIDSGNYVEVAKFSENATRMYEKAGKDRFARFSLATYADALSNIGQKERALKLLDSLDNLSTQNSFDSLLNFQTIRLKIPLLYRSSQDERLETELERIFKFNDKYNTSVNF